MGLTLICLINLNEINGLRLILIRAWLLWYSWRQMLLSWIIANPFNYLMGILLKSIRFNRTRFVLQYLISLNNITCNAYVIMKWQCPIVICYVIWPNFQLLLQLSNRAVHVAGHNSCFRMPNITSHRFEVINRFPS